MTDDMTARLGALRDYLGATDGTGRATIVVPLTWPDIRNAEYEVIERLCRAAANIGSRILVTDNDGYPIRSSDGRAVDPARRVGPDEADFMVSLHFESPRLIDLYSYYAVWQPIDFYFQFGYDGSVDKLLTHTDALSCAADRSDAHIRNLMGSAGTLPDAPFPYLFHSPPGPYHPPGVTARSRLFYIGINWERLGRGGKGRYQKLLEMLERADLIDIYGPRELLGKKVWEGFDTYRGELPFDGESVVRAVHGSGICLALSSDAHRADGVMSNRLFEGLAAGAAIIANPHPFIAKYFADVVHVLPETRDEGELFAAIERLVGVIRADPSAANERARIGQERLRELFSPERCLQALIDRHPARARARAGRTAGLMAGLTAGRMVGNAASGRARDGDAVNGDPANGDVANGDAASDAAGGAAAGDTAGGPLTVLLATSSGDHDALAATVASLARQSGVGIELVVACDRDAAPAAILEPHRAAFAALTLVAPPHGARAFAGSGAALAAALAHVRGPYLAIVREGTEFFAEHFAGLLARIVGEDAPAAVSGVLAETDVEVDGERRGRRRLHSLAFEADAASLLADPSAIDPGRLVVRSDLLVGPGAGGLSLLDGAEGAYMALRAARRGPIVQTGTATCVRRDDPVPASPVPASPGAAGPAAPAASGAALQRQVLADTIRFERGPMHAPAVSQRGEPGHPGVATMVRATPYDTAIGGNGVPFLREGFEEPSLEFVRVAGHRAGMAAALEPPAHPIERLNLCLQIAGDRAAGNAPRTCEVRVNDHAIGTLVVRSGSRRFALPLPPEVLKDRPSWMRIELRVSRAASRSGKGTAGKDAAGKDAAGKDTAGKDTAAKKAAGKNAGTASHSLINVRRLGIYPAGVAMPRRRRQHRDTIGARLLRTLRA